MLQVEKSLGRKPKQLAELPDCPEELAYVWEWYQQVFTGSRLTFSELESWSRMLRINPRAWEIECLISLDRIFWSVHNVS